MKKMRYPLVVLGVALAMLVGLVTPAQAHPVYAKFDNLALAWTNSAHNRVGVEKLACGGGWARVDGRFYGVWLPALYDYTCGDGGEGTPVAPGLEYIRACFQDKGCSTPVRVT